MLKRFGRTETFVFLGVWLMLMVLGRERLFGDPGSLWHIIVGERILNNGELIRTDPFSFTCARQPWLAQWWLFECGLALLHRAGGLSTILLATVTAIAALCAWVARRAVRAGIHPLIAVLIAAAVLVGTSYHLHPRPHLVTILLVGWTFARLCDFEVGRVSVRGLVWLVPVFVIWTNIHGGMVGGVGMLVAAALGWAAARLLGWEQPVDGWRGWAGLGALVLACALTPLANPYGAALPPVWFALMGSPALPLTMDEHRPLLESGDSGWVVLGLGVLHLAALLGTLPARPRVTWLIPLVWLGLSWTRIRYGPLFAVTAGLALIEMFPHVRWVAWLARHGSETCRLRPPDAPAGWRPALVPALLVLGLAGLQLAGFEIPVLGAGWARPDPAKCPTELLPEVRAYARSHPEGTPVFNDMLFGGFLIYFTPELRVFIDDRCELYGEERLKEFADASRHHPERVEQWAHEHGFDLALVLPGQGFDSYLRAAPGWVEVKRTEAAVLYRRACGDSDRCPQEGGAALAAP
jgi:hypothetical protein